MIKPVKRDKRLKWIDSRYAVPFRKLVFRLTVDIKPFKKAMRKVVKAVNRFGEATERLGKSYNSKESIGKDNCYSIIRNPIRF